MRWQQGPLSPVGALQVEHVTQECHVQKSYIHTSANDNSPAPAPKISLASEIESESEQQQPALTEDKDPELLAGNINGQAICAITPAPGRAGLACLSTLNKPESSAQRVSQATPLS